MTHLLPFIQHGAEIKIKKELSLHKCVLRVRDCPVRGVPMPVFLKGAMSQNSRVFSCSPFQMWSFNSCHKSGKNVVVKQLCLSHNMFSVCSVLSEVYTLETYTFQFQPLLTNRFQKPEAPVIFEISAPCALCFLREAIIYWLVKCC